MMSAFLWVYPLRLGTWPLLVVFLCTRLAHLPGISLLGVTVSESRLMLRLKVPATDGNPPPTGSCMTQRGFTSRHVSIAIAYS